MTSMQIESSESAQVKLPMGELQLAHVQALARIGYWQWDVRADVLTWSDELFRIHGLEPQSLELSYESFLGRIHPDDRGIVEETVAHASGSGEPFAFEYRIERPDGTLHWLQGRGEVEMGDSGALRMNGVCQDITEHKLTEAELRLLGTLSVATGAAEDLASALGTAVQHVCEVTQWVLGAAWVPSKDGAHLEYVCGWHAGAPELEEFKVVSKGFAFPPGIGLPGRVWASRQPAWVRDLAVDPNSPRVPWATRARLRAGLAVPVTSGSEVLSVLEFFVREPRAEDERLVGIVSAVAAQLGTVVRRKRAEEELRQSEQRYRVMIETSNDAVVSIASSGVVTEWNEAASAIFGWTRDEAVGRLLAELIIPDRYRERHRQGLAHYVETGEGAVVGKTIELVALRRDGREFPVELTIWPVRTGEQLTFSAFVRDITERRQAHEKLEERERQLAYAQAVARIGSWRWAVPTDVVTWSDELFRIWGLEPQSVEVSHESYLGMLHPDDRARVEETIERAYESGEPFAFDHRIERPDGVVRWLHCRGEVVMGDSGPVAMHGTAQDVTEHKEAEEALRVLAHRLELSNRDLEDFASSASHDLREPLRKVQAFGDRLRTRHGHALPQEARDYLDRMLSAADRMETLIDGLIQLSRIGAKGAPFARVDLVAVARGVVSDLEARIEQSGGRVEIGALPTIDADPVEMRQLLLNLIANAIKFHKPDEPPAVAVVADAGPGGHGDKGVVRLFVKDNGVGFDEKYLDRIFEPFQRVHKRSEYEGAGIGLALCRKIVERHGGGISARSVANRGSMFVVTLPLRQAA